jgi:hypothetical protein
MERDPNSWDITAETGVEGEFIDSPNISIRAFMVAIHRWMPEESLKQTHCLQYIDDYGDTTFNRLQKRVLLSELEALVLKGESPEAREFFQPIIDFIAKYKDKTHTYIKFYGD